MPTHWLRACGIFQKIKNDGMDLMTPNIIPLPKQRIDEPLILEQFLILWLIFAIGLALAATAFLFEIGIGARTKEHKRNVIQNTSINEMPSPPREDIALTIVHALTEVE